MASHLPCRWDQLLSLAKNCNENTAGPRLLLTTLNCMGETEKVNNYLETMNNEVQEEIEYDQRQYDDENMSLEELIDSLAGSMAGSDVDHDRLISTPINVPNAKTSKKYFFLN